MPKIDFKCDYCGGVEHTVIEVEIPGNAPFIREKYGDKKTYLACKNCGVRQIPVRIAGQNKNMEVINNV